MFSNKLIYWHYFRFLWNFFATVFKHLQGFYNHYCFDLKTVQGFFFNIILFSKFQMVANCQLTLFAWCRLSREPLARGQKKVAHWPIMCVVRTKMCAFHWFVIVPTYKMAAWWHLSKRIHHLCPLPIMFIFNDWNHYVLHQQALPLDTSFANNRPCT